VGWIKIANRKFLNPSTKKERVKILYFESYYSSFR
jgi:hypothetical protein